MCYKLDTVWNAEKIRGSEKLNRETGCGDTPLVYVLQIRYGMERGKNSRLRNTEPRNWLRRHAAWSR